MRNDRNQKKSGREGNVRQPKRRVSEVFRKNKKGACYHPRG
jgi:hypothetical protein